MSDTIRYDEIKSMSEILELVNVMFSHELRNPLNSIIAQNVHKKALYKQLTSLVSILSHDQLQQPHQI